MAESRFEKELLEATKFLKQHNLEFYLRDAVDRFLTSSEIKPPYETTPASFLVEYFCNVHEGTHILLQEFSFISGTLYNRLCVIRAITLMYEPLMYKSDTLDAKNYHSLLQLVFPGFPFSVVQSAFDLSETPEQQNVELTFVEFVKFLKRSFCVGKFHYEDKIISAEIDIKIEELSKSYELKRENLLKGKSLQSLDESDCFESFQGSITENSDQSIELELSEGNTTSSEESEKETDEKLPFSLPGFSPEQNVSILEERGDDQLYRYTIISGTNLSSAFEKLSTLMDPDSTLREKSVEETDEKIALLPYRSKEASKGKKNVRHFKKKDEDQVPVRSFDLGKDAISLRKQRSDPISREKPTKRFERKLSYSSYGIGTTKVMQSESTPQKIKNKGRKPLNVPMTITRIPDDVKYFGVKQPGLSSGSKGTTEVYLDQGTKPRRLPGSEPFSRGKSSKTIGGNTTRPSFGFKDSFASKRIGKPLEERVDVHQLLENTRRLAQQSKLKGIGKLPSKEEPLSSGKPDEGTGRKLPYSYSGARPKKM
ncbi:UPF0705 protein C11orf49 [Nephila pilipes]|uniref:Centriolar satellite-associated tubulin polyglutamylase complex regulator 1 n=1 Tax=Nephila pilipes TaxID=299642 RepID=A0A8X6IWC0_NEPPI|nr:UPF0705 protein C11orf49 [Nephila pilipes]